MPKAAIPNPASGSRTDPVVGISDQDEGGEAGDDHQGADDLPPEHVLLGEPVAERQGEDHRHDQQRLDHDQTALAECDRLRRVADQQDQAAEQPDRDRDHAQQADHRGHPPAPLGELELALLLECRRQGEAERGDKGQERSHQDSSPDMSQLYLRR